MKLLGAIFGDICGSVYEYKAKRIKDKGLITLFDEDSDFTDDTILTIAVADAIINKESMKEKLYDYGYKYPSPKGGYGGSFVNWLSTPFEDAKPYYSYGNGAPMRVSACGWLGNSIEEVMELAKKSAEPTHNHPEAIKGAQATAVAIYKLRNGCSKEELKEYIEKEFGYDLSVSIDEMRKTSKFEISTQLTMPQALVSFFDANSMEETCLNAISLGADADTVAAIACSIAEAYYGISEDVQKKILSYLPKEFIDIIIQVNEEI